MSKQKHSYAVFVTSLDALVAAIEAGQACANMRSNNSFPFNTALENIRRFAEALRPEWATKERQTLRSWETSASKDERRAVKVLLADYEVLRDKAAALLAEMVSVGGEASS